MVRQALMYDAQSSRCSKTFEPKEMLEHIVLRILAGSHRRNMKLLEVLQGAAVLSIRRWRVHTFVSLASRRKNKADIFIAYGPVGQMSSRNSRS
jgi:hypothetical protein